MKLPRFPLLAALLAGLAGFVCSADPAEDAAAFPTPPMQGKPWTAPASKLPAPVVDAIGELFDQGMADPRGCEYREVEIFDTASMAAIDKVHAWVLPGDGEKRFAVGWNGRVNPVVSVGPLVDLRKDFPPGDGESVYYDDYSDRLGTYDKIDVSSGSGAATVVTQHGSLSESSTLPIKVALLLRLGEADLAGEVWKKWKGNPDDAYLAIAREWLVSWFHWADNLTKRGADPRALQAFRQLLPLKKAAEISAARRRIPFPMTHSGDSWRKDMAPGKHSKFYFEELEPLTALLADQERRAKEAPYIPVLISGVPAAGPERITALVRDLEGTSWLLGDPTIRELVRQGDSAIDPLLQCLEDDQRMTAGGQPVYGAAYVALTAILKITPTLPLAEDGKAEALTPDERKTLAEKFRAYRDEKKGMTLPERWFATLQDDNAQLADWGDAALNLTERPGSMLMGPNMFYPHEADGGGRMDPSEPMRGELLRAKSNPSLSDLLVKRSRQLLSGSLVANNPASLAVDKLLRALADWDGKTRASDLEEMSAKYNSTLVDGGGHRVYPTALCLALYQKRLAAGDPAALAGYGAWLSTLRPDPKQAAGSKADFRLMWEHPTDPDIRTAAEKMFAGRDAPWSFLAGKVSKTHGESHSAVPGRETYISQLVNTPMLGLAAFRGLVLRALNDTTIIGFAKPYRDGTGESADYLYQYYYESDEADQYSQDFRRCDFYASLLAGADGFPAFDLMWPQKKRDAAVEGCKKLLKQYGDAFQFNPQDKDNWNFAAPGVHARPAFPKLDHPATPEDVAQGRAIFSLAGTVRLAPLPLPIHAERPISGQDVDVYQDWLPNGMTERDSSCPPDGYVCQAEEVLVDGKWQRFYGFAGRHLLGKVPAAEIEFRGGYPWVGLTASLDAALDGPRITKPGAKPSTADHVTTVGAPLPMMVKLRNHGAEAEEAPAALALPPGADKALPQGMTLKLSWSPTIPREAWFPEAVAYAEWGFSNQYFSFAGWSDVPPRDRIAAVPEKIAAPSVAVAPDSEAAVMRFDLRDYFDIGRPGSYRVQAIFHLPGEPAVKSQEVIFTVMQKID